jgi:hypothetical protein
MKRKSLCALLLGIVLVLAGCSSAPSAADKAKENQITRLKESVCEITRATGKDAIFVQDLADFYNNGVGPNDTTDPARENFYVVAIKWRADVEKLEALVGRWSDEDGYGFLKFCNSK